VYCKRRHIAMGICYPQREKSVSAGIHPESRRFL
jgi:hypothetical protein